MTWKKYEIIYKGKVAIGTREVSMVPDVVLVDKKTQAKKVDHFTAPVPKSKPPGIANAGRTEQVIEECKKLGIKDPVQVHEMLIAKYAGTKTENYIKHRLDHALKML